MLIHDKICRHCRKTDIPLHLESTTKYGMYYSCRTCQMVRQRKYRRTKNGSLNTRKAVMKSIEKYKFKQDARQKVYYQVRRGYIVRPDICSICGLSTKVEAHHKNYQKPLDVMWVCRTCHLMV